MYTPHPAATPETKHSPLFSIRFRVKNAIDKFHKWLIPRQDHVDQATGAIVRKHFGDKDTALKHWNEFLETKTSHDGEPLAECELIYGGDLVSENAQVAGGQVLEKWDDKTGYQKLLTPPELQQDEPAPAAQIAIVDVTTDKALSSGAPVLDAENAHVPKKDAPLTQTPIDGTPHVPKVLVTEQPTGGVLTSTPKTDASVTEVPTNVPAVTDVDPKKETSEEEFENQSDEQSKDASDAK